MPKIISITALLILSSFCALSCSPNQKLVKRSSVFVSVNELGVSKAEFIKKFGKPFSKDLREENGTLIESLYYAEIIERIPVTTKFTFVNDILIEQSKENIDFKADEIKELNDEIRRVRLKNIRERTKGNN